MKNESKDIIPTEIECAHNYNLNDLSSKLSSNSEAAFFVIGGLYKFQQSISNHESAGPIAYSSLSIATKKDDILVGTYGVEILNVDLVVPFVIAIISMGVLFWFVERKERKNTKEKISTKDSILNYVYEAILTIFLNLKALVSSFEGKVLIFAISFVALALSGGTLSALISNKSYIFSKIKFFTKGASRGFGGLRGKVVSSPPHFKNLLNSIDIIAENSNASSDQILVLDSFLVGHTNRNRCELVRCKKFLIRLFLSVFTYNYCYLFF